MATNTINQPAIIPNFFSNFSRIFSRNKNPKESANGKLRTELSIAKQLDDIRTKHLAQFDQSFSAKATFLIKRF